ncbi:hypothetical protein [Vibrio kanaloae]|uniref:hypothetical protein n=1 Tax=Vibrio kanaloae TaxID=170673 RepID=UPI001248156E|nr:hypothetical protein [Vibrio kanaloae]KAB0463169.1 hypothetical protein F7Q89_14820 [Vibrio kanaloae]
MIIKQTRKSLVTNHHNIIFQSKADDGDLSKAIGRADDDGNAVFLSDGAGGGGTKFQALHDSGMQIHLAKGSSGNWYITDLIDDISDVEMYESVSLNEKALDESISYLPEDGFLVHLAESNSDDYVSIYFTSNELEHEFCVGHISDGRYTLAKSFPNIGEFDVIEKENDDGEIVAFIDNASLKGQSIIDINRVLKPYDEINVDDLIQGVDDDLFSEGVDNMVQQALRYVQRNGV